MNQERIQKAKVILSSEAYQKVRPSKKRSVEATLLARGLTQEELQYVREEIDREALQKEGKSSLLLGRPK